VNGTMSLSPTSTDAARLLRLARHGDEAARDELVGAHRRAAYLFALHLLGNQDDALDVAQEAMLRFLSSLERLRPDREIRPWLFAIVRNCARDLWRRRARRAHTPLDDSIPSLARALVDSEPGPEEQFARQEEKHRLWKAVSSLSAAQREILVLRDYHDFSYAEIAETLDIPLGTVMSRLHAARRSLSRVFRSLYVPTEERQTK
jgi:RNA polymerase sigma-70 factor (ECF subfamily)